MREICSHLGGGKEVGAERRAPAQGGEGGLLNSLSGCVGGREGREGTRVGNPNSWVLGSELPCKCFPTEEPLGRGGQGARRKKHYIRTKKPQERGR